MPRAPLRGPRNLLLYSWLWLTALRTSHGSTCLPLTDSMAARPADV